MLIDLVRARVGEMQAFSGRVSDALEFEAMFREPAKLQQKRRAFVVPLGRNARPPVNASGVHHQATEQLVGVAFALRTADNPSGQGMSSEIEALELEIIDQIAGWQPEGFKAAFQLLRSRLHDLRDGVAFFELQFSISHYIRKDFR